MVLLKKQVHFSGDIELIDALPNEEYDRTAQQVAKLSYHDMYELLLLKSQWRQESQQQHIESVMADQGEEVNQRGQHGQGEDHYDGDDRDDKSVITRSPSPTSSMTALASPSSSFYYISIT